MTVCAIPINNALHTFFVQFFVRPFNLLCFVLLIRRGGGDEKKIIFPIGETLLRCIFQQCFDKHKKIATHFQISQHALQFLYYARFSALSSALVHPSHVILGFNFNAPRNQKVRQSTYLLYYYTLRTLRPLINTITLCTHFDVRTFRRLTSDPPAFTRRLAFKTLICFEVVHGIVMHTVHYRRTWGFFHFFFDWRQSRFIR